MAYLDTELEKAVESHPDMSLGKMQEHSSGGYVIYLSCNDETYSVNEDRRVQYEGYKTIIESNLNLSVNEMLGIVQAHATSQ